ncbi:MFS transporter [Corynebacterium diphtheriae]|nr:MFS transporter [Corynebacterium diphtheriae]
MPQKQQSAVHPRDWFPVAATMIAIAWGGNEFTPLLVMYRATSHFEQVVVNGLLGAYVIGIVAALLIAGPLSDLIGRRPTLLPAIPISLFGSVLMSLAPHHPVVIGAGRIFSGIALGLVMAVGSTWITELSAASGTDATADPRRAGLCLTGGFLVGAGVASILAQWAPAPAHTPYVLHIILTVFTGFWLLKAPETNAPELGTVKAAWQTVGFRRFFQDLRIPAAAHKRFLRVVVPVAPWVFGCAGAAYAILPQLLATSAGNTPIAFSGLMTVLTLGCGAGIQIVGKLIDTRESARASVVAMAIITVGVAIGAVAASDLNIWIGILSAMLMGMGYGLALVAGLSEVQRIAQADDLAGLTAIYYSVAYLGFFIPMAFAALNARFSYTVLFSVGTVLALACLIAVTTAWRAHLPGVRHIAVAA